MSGLDDRELVDRFVSDRDEAAFRELYRRHTPAVYGLAVRLLGPRDPCVSDVVQEVWCRAADGIRRFEWSSALRTWLVGIAMNCCREQIRDRMRARAEAAVAPAPALPAAREEPGLDVERALADLAPGYREILVLHDVEGYTHEEIAQMLGVAPGTSKSQLSRARRALRARLAGESSAVRMHDDESERR